MKISEMEVPDVPDCKMVIGVAMAIKYIDDDGDVSFCFRNSEGITTLEAHGMLATAANVSMINIMGGFRDK